MIVARDRLAVSDLTTVLTGSFDLPTVLDTVATVARAAFDAASTTVILLDGDHRADDSGIQVVAEALRDGADIDPRLLTNGPGPDCARSGVVTMVADFRSAGDTRWEGYRPDALRAGILGIRAFPLKVLGSSIGALVVHTDDPWGVERPSELGVTLANLAALAISVDPHSEQRRSDTTETIEVLLRGTVAIATATGLIAELTSVDPAVARRQLQRLARAHRVTVTKHAEAIVNAHNADPSGVTRSPLLATPSSPPPPPRLDS